MEQFVSRSKLYHVHRKLGEGGFGKVYLVQDVRLDPLFRKPLAMKLLKEEQIDAAFQDYLLQIANLDHPNIINLYGMEVVNDKPALVFEYIDGPSLLQYLSFPSCSEKKLELILRQVFACLGFLLEQDKFHGDLSAGNIMIDSQRGAVLIDFDPRLDWATAQRTSQGMEKDLRDLQALLLSLIERRPDVSLAFQNWLFRVCAELEQLDSFEFLRRYRDLPKTAGSTFFTATEREQQQQTESTPDWTQSIQVEPPPLFAIGLFFSCLILLFVARP